MGHVLYTPQSGTKPATMRVSWLRIELVTFLFAERCSTNWATPVRAVLHFLIAVFYCEVFSLYAILIYVWRELENR